VQPKLMTTQQEVRHNVMVMIIALPIKSILGQNYLQLSIIKVKVSAPKIVAITMALILIIKE